jgi:hypothetical protein
MRTLLYKFVFLMPLMFLCATASQARMTKTAETCGVDTTHPPQRILADVAGNGAWQEYEGVAAIPDLNLNGGAAAWRGWEQETRY